jgi:hypothetical protein
MPGVGVESDNEKWMEHFMCLLDMWLCASSGDRAG